MNICFTLYNHLNSSYNEYLFLNGSYVMVFTIWATEHLVKQIYKPEIMYILRHSSRRILTPLIHVMHSSWEAIDLQTVILLFLYALYHMKRVPVCLWQDNINLILQVSTQHISKIRKKASFSVAMFTEDDIYSLGRSIQNIMMGHLTCQQRKSKYLNIRHGICRMLNHKSGTGFLTCPPI